MLIPHAWIDLPDGSRLGCRMWLPNGVDGAPVPAVLEYVPYRKDDGTYVRDSTLHPGLSERGYACVRVDMRGSGSSDGVLTDEYSHQEMDDGEAVIEWIAAQPWCDGNVGMIGISWGGITGLQMATRQPEALKAVVALGSTDARYYDDGGYYMGAMIGQTIGWAALMLGYNSRPPVPAHYGEGWRELWMRRLADAPMFLGIFLEHQREDDYWMRGTVAADYEAISTPIFAVSGHADCWPNTVPRLMANLAGPRQGLQGAWAHRYPQMAVPGPAIDFMPEVERWFDRWLKGDDNEDEVAPLYRVFLQDHVPPQTFYADRPGRWLAFDEWPSADVAEATWKLDELTSGPEDAAYDICSPQTVGMDGGEYMPWFNFGPGPELPDDQRVDDEGSACFDTAPLTEALSIVGNARLHATVTTNASQALLAARLCAVDPDGRSTFIARGIVNLSQRHSKAEPEPLSPGRPADVVIEFDHVGYTVPVDHRLRLALSTSYWPMAWPSPTYSTVTVDPGSELVVPVWSGSSTQRDRVSFNPAPQPAASPVEQVRPHDEQRRRFVDETTGRHVLQIDTDNGCTSITELAAQVDSGATQKYSIHSDDPLSAEAEYRFRWAWQMGDVAVETIASTRMWCTETTFEVEAEIVASEHDVEVFRRPIRESYPRDHF